jgi:glutamine synthetase
MVNTVLCTIASKVFKDFAARLEAGELPQNVTSDALSNHWRVVFNGNSYDVENQKMLTERGLCNIPSSVDALQRLTDERNIALFEEMKVLTRGECVSRCNVMLSHYINTVEMEALCMIDMINQSILPVVKENNVEHYYLLNQAVKNLRIKLHDIETCDSLAERAAKSRELRLETMIECRALCDEAEAVCPANQWPIATYTDLLFMKF